jgi:urea transport system permease protein
MKKSFQTTLIILVLALLVVAPGFLSEFRLNLIGKFLTFAIVAVGLDLIWGYTGIVWGCI